MSETPIKIELVLPGEQRQTVISLPESYRITVERDDGMACTEIEAQTAMSMLCIQLLHGQKPRKKSSKKAGA